MTPVQRSQLVTHKPCRLVLWVWRKVVWPADDCCALCAFLNSCTCNRAATFSLPQHRATVRFRSFSTAIARLAGQNGALPAQWRPASACVTTETRHLDRLGQIGEFERCQQSGGLPARVVSLPLAPTGIRGNSAKEDMLMLTVPASGQVTMS